MDSQLGPTTPSRNLGSMGAGVSLTSTPAPKTILVIGHIQDGLITEYTVQYRTCVKCGARSTGRFCDGHLEQRLDQGGTDVD
jgi:hypothetical protein